jgi:RHS repeat-associated protein
MICYPGVPRCAPDHIGDGGLATGAIELDALAFGLALTCAIAQVIVHLRTHRPEGVRYFVFFGAAGQRRNAAGLSGNPTSGAAAQFAAITRRGYTFHEMLDNLNLNHMNGRVYDQATGTFLSPDPFVSNPGSTQSYNRYAYTFGNPLKYTDPSGFVPSPDDDPDAPTCAGICFYYGSGGFSASVNFGYGVPQTRSSIYLTGVRPRGLTNTPLRSGAGTVPANGVECDMVACGSERSSVGGVGVAVDVLINGRAFTITEVVVGNALTAKVGYIATDFVVQPNCSAAFESRPNVCVGAVESVTFIDEAILAVFGGAFVGRGAAAATAASGVLTRATILALLRARALQLAGFSGSSTPLILDTNLAARGVVETLRQRGFNIRTVAEIFGKDPGDPAIRKFAETVGARAVSKDRARNKLLGGGVGDNRIKIPGRLQPNADDIERLIREQL